jgi:hypothetical protein
MVEYAVRLTRRWWYCLITVTKLFSIVQNLMSSHYIKRERKAGVPIERILYA